MQSHDYVPGVSGWKIEDGRFEINAATIKVGGLSPEPQFITITAAEWNESDIPHIALERCRFIRDAINAIPDQYRGNAEFSTEDRSFEGNGSDLRTLLTYRRAETSEEAAARVERAKVAGTRVVHKNGCMTIIHDGVVRVRLGNLEQPFVVEDDQLFISEAAVENGTVTNNKVSPQWSIKLEVRNGQYVAAGIGIGSQLLTSADKFAVKDEQPKSEIEQAIAEGNAQKILDLIAGTISETELGKSMIAEGEPFADRVRAVIRDELRAGGLLHRI
ncbi:phage tail tip fiber protein [Pseudomonas abietaniphila]|uniref:Tip attachment protein J central straight fiber domain-containing protein n=1 Tax=Pseudomonas abietaniphila TaxID=89065 RepID=A0A1G8KAR8_9PSED|nr:DUF1983 domain-containing protein [Pseudomonas abietaniphila]SDI40483.1 protein of unknown function [Pseudomonas abietaniphila]